MHRKWSLFEKCIGNDFTKESQWNLLFTVEMHRKGFFTTEKMSFFQKQCIENNFYHRNA